MTSETDELCETVLIINQRGLHARAAAKFVRVVEGCQAEVTVARDETRVSGRSIMGLMMLAATRGTKLKICATGSQAAAVIENLSALVKRGFDED